MKSRTAFPFILLSFLALSSAPITALGSAGDLYVANLVTDDITRIAPDGTKTLFADGFTDPGGVAFDFRGTLFVAEVNSNVIYEFATNASRSTFVSSLHIPEGIAFDGAGNLFVAESNIGVITKITPAGTKSTFASGFMTPVNVAFDAAGNLFVADQQAGTITKVTATGQQIPFANDMIAPTGLAFDKGGNLFVSDVTGQIIYKFTPAGLQTTFISELGATSLAFDAAGNLFGSDFNNGIIEKVTPTGSRTTFASGLVGAFVIAFEPNSEKLRNISTRGFVQTGDSVLIGGFIVGGSALINNAVVIRAIGPSLSSLGVPDPLLDPTLEIHDETGAVIATNDDWEDSQGAQIEATGLAPNDPMESAVFATLPAGSYTAIVRGVGETTGNALVEVYSIR